MNLKALTVNAALAMLAGFPSASFAVESSGPDGARNDACAKIAATYGACDANIRFDPKTSLVSLSPYQSRVACSDGVDRTYWERVENMDVASMLSIVYRQGVVSLPTSSLNDDPGRLRFDPLFFEVYGASAAEVRTHLVHVKFLNQTILFNARNGAAAALASVNTALMNAVKTDADLAAYLRPWLTKRYDLREMTFNWRKIADTDRLSNHSFGSAIDLYEPASREPVYWLWDLASQRKRAIEKRTGKKVKYEDVLKAIREPQTQDFQPTRLQHVPQRLVDIFESQGFIWGGKWYHFDAMHFEFRPELFSGLRPQCGAFSQKPGKPSAPRAPSALVRWLELYHRD